MPSSQNIEAVRDVALSRISCLEKLDTVKIKFDRQGCYYNKTQIVNDEDELLLNVCHANGPSTANNYLATSTDSFTLHLRDKFSNKNLVRFVKTPFHNEFYVMIQGNINLGVVKKKKCLFGLKLNVYDGYFQKIYQIRGSTFRRMGSKFQYKILNYYGYKIGSIIRKPDGLLSTKNTCQIDFPISVNVQGKILLIAAALFLDYVEFKNISIDATPPMMFYTF
ncbi:hypothetical protein HCN44_003844 [Aphidius gifuensis]|uniref:Phospholipid scramblase n=1 Tax=Aphidius gifuensis TaxID=684658 RepID=A0A834XZ84_APHGI|nr:hypothetical protein HCN44_003844 [Aphidius gifuensis]